MGSLLFSALLVLLYANAWAAHTSSDGERLTDMTQETGKLLVALNAEGCGVAMSSRFLPDVPLHLDVVMAQNRWVVLLHVIFGNSISTCSGIIVTHIHVVTNAQCLVREAVTPSSVTVLYGSSTKYQGNHVNGTHFILHPHFSEETLANDIALLMVKQHFVWSWNTGPVCVPGKKFDIEGHFVVAAGWGNEDNSSRPQKTLYTTVLQVAPASDCRGLYQRYDFDEGTMLCAKRVDDNFCEGDTGGPVVAAGKNGGFYLVGIWSYGTPCARQEERIYPSVLTRVSAFTTWIAQSVNSSGNYTMLPE